MDVGPKVVQRVGGLSQNLRRPGGAVEGGGIHHHSCRISRDRSVSASIPGCSVASHLRIERNSNYANEAERLSGRLRSDLDYVTIGDIFQLGLHEYLETIQERLVEISDAIRDVYFAQSQLIPTD